MSILICISFVQVLKLNNLNNVYQKKKVLEKTLIIIIHSVKSISGNFSQNLQNRTSRKRKQNGEVILKV